MAADKKGDKKAAPAAGDAGDASQKKKKLMMMIGIGVALVLISVGSTIGVLKMLSPQKSGEAESAEHASAASEPVEAEAIYYPLKPSFTVNFDVNGRQRFLQADLTLMFRDPGLQKTLELHMPEVRNSLVLLLSNQVFDDLQTVDGKEKLRDAALEEIQDILAKEQANAFARMPAKEKEKFKKEHGRGDPPNVEQVLFTNFVMQ